MDGLLFDGRKSRPWPVRIVVEDGRVVVRAVEDPEVAIDWPLAKVREEPLADGRLRLAVEGGDARLIVDPAGWRALTGTPAPRGDPGHWRLVAGLAAGGAALAAIVFVGVPMAAAPLARMTPPELEAQLGANMSRQLMIGLRPCGVESEGGQALARLGAELAEGSDAPFPILTHAVRAPFANAFALPGGTILVTDKLIAEAKSSDELAAVLAHEIAHVEKRHAMQAAWRSMGAGLLLDAVVGGGTGAGQQAVLLAGGFADQRFSRELENEADTRAFELLNARGISSQGMADFFRRMGGRKDDPRLRRAAEWFSTHPDSVARAERAQTMARPGRPALDAPTWSAVKRACGVQVKPRFKSPF